MFRLQNEGNQPREKWVGGSILASAVDLRENLAVVVSVAKFGCIFQETDDRLIYESLWK